MTTTSPSCGSGPLSTSQVRRWLEGGQAGDCRERAGAGRESGELISEVSSKHRKPYNILFGDCSEFWHHLDVKLLSTLAQAFLGKKVQALFMAGLQVGFALRSQAVALFTNGLLRSCPQASLGS